MLRAVCSEVGRLCRDRHGGVAIIAGLTLPALVLGVGAAVEYASLAARHSKLQVAADEAALAATQQLRLINNNDSVVNSIARSVIASSAPTPQGGATSVTTNILEKRTSVRVSINETVGSLLGRLLSMPTMRLAVTSTAKLSGTAKLCLVTLDPDKGKAMNIEKGSSITAEGCAIYSNSAHKQGLSAKDAQATAGLICSVGGVDQKNATLSPSPLTDCPRISDPLASIARPNVGSCTATDLKISTAQTLYPGTYCKGIEVKGAGQLTLMPGVYVLDNGPLIVSGSATLTGQNVGVFFTGAAGGMRLDPDTTISLTAPKTGEMAGLLFFEDRTVSAAVAPPVGPKGSAPAPPTGSPPMRQYRITSNNAPTLLGTIYLPAGRLIVDASRPVADRSAYTVIVTRQIEINSGPNLYLNSNYAGTDIPVPQGVGPNSGAVSLTQ